MNKKTITFDQKNVRVHGGFKCPEKGHFVEITNENGFIRNGEMTKRISVPFWNLSFPDENTANETFNFCFRYSLSTGKVIDIEKGLNPKLIFNEK